MIGIYVKDWWRLLIFTCFQVIQTWWFDAWEGSETKWERVTVRADQNILKTPDRNFWSPSVLHKDSSLNSMQTCRWRWALWGHPRPPHTRVIEERPVFPVEVLFYTPVFSLQFLTLSRSRFIHNVDVDGCCKTLK